MRGAWVLWAVIFGIAGAATLIAIGLFLNRRKLPEEPADVALVFGTGLDWKADSRVRAAAAAFDRGLARHFIVSGGVPMPGLGGVTEAQWFRDQMVDRGVPPDRIHLENRARNTAENVELSTPILLSHGWTRVLLIMSDFEGIRAHLTARRAWHGRGLEIFDLHADSTGHWNPWTWWLSREGWHLTWYTVPRLFRYRLLPYLWR
jgi:uncharacterized SAM-binding protein YcdF (DUF218 family)